MSTEPDEQLVATDLADLADVPLDELGKQLGDDDAARHARRRRTAARGGVVQLGDLMSRVGRWARTTIFRSASLGAFAVA